MERVLQKIKELKEWDFSQCDGDSVRDHILKQIEAEAILDTKESNTSQQVKEPKSEVSITQKEAKRAVAIERINNTCAKCQGNPFDNKDGCYDDDIPCIDGSRFKEKQQPKTDELLQAYQKFVEDAMWIYAKEKGTDNIIGLYVCDDFKDWYNKRISQVTVTDEEIHIKAQEYNMENSGGGQSFQDGAKWLKDKPNQK